MRSCLDFVLTRYPLTAVLPFPLEQNDDEDDPSGGRKKPTLVSIPNPLYSGSRAFAEPYGVGSSQIQNTSNPEEVWAKAGEHGVSGGKPFFSGGDTLAALSILSFFNWTKLF